MNQSSAGVRPLCTPATSRATMLHILGIDHNRFTHPFRGLDVRLTGVEEAHVVQGILDKPCQSRSRMGELNRQATKTPPIPKRATERPKHEQTDASTSQETRSRQATTP